MRIKRRNFSDFNKEVVYGEIGAVLGSAIASAITSHFFSSSRVRIAQFAVVGSILGGGLLFLLKKIKNKRRRGEPILKSIIHDLKYFTPAAAIIACFICYPTLYYLMKYFVKIGWQTFPAGAISELVSFCIFFCCVNLYRFTLSKLFHKNIG
jgi:hypothetical protein